MDNKKREYCVGVKIINCFYVEAENRTEAEEIVRNMDNDEILLDSDFNIEYADPTNGEIAWKIKADEVDWNQLNNKDDDWTNHLHDLQ